MGKVVETQLIEEVRLMNARLAKIEETLSAIQQELSRPRRLSAAEYSAIDVRLAEVANKFAADYSLSNELTVFTTDGADEFYEAG